MGTIVNSYLELEGSILDRTQCIQEPNSVTSQGNSRVQNIHSVEKNKKQS